MSTTTSSTSLGEALASVLQKIINAIAGIVGGIADAVSQYAGTIGTILVVAGITGLVMYTLFRHAPFVGQVFGRILRF